MTSPTRQGGGRAEYAARALQELVEQAAPGDHLGTKVVLQSRFGVSVGTLNEATTPGDLVLGVVEISGTCGWIARPGDVASRDRVAG